MNVMIFKKKFKIKVNESHKLLDMLTLNLIRFPISIFCWKCAYISKMAYLFCFFNRAWTECEGVFDVEY